MREHGGSIVLASSAAAQTGIANHEAIAAAKGGIIALVRSAAATYGANGVRVNAVAPGLVRAGMTARLVDNEAQAEASRRMHVLGRSANRRTSPPWSRGCWTPTTWVTGQTIGVDGGLGQVRARGHDGAHRTMPRPASAGQRGSSSAMRTPRGPQRAAPRGRRRPVRA
jgi:3-oxoacyl-[acyl-carrier protein] reductase